VHCDLSIQTNRLPTSRTIFSTCKTPRLPTVLRGAPALSLIEKTGSAPFFRQNKPSLHD
jgi:hypothetical protein